MFIFDRGKRNKYFDNTIPEEEDSRFEFEVKDENNSYIYHYYVEDNSFYRESKEIVTDDNDTVHIYVRSFKIDNSTSFEGVYECSLKKGFLGEFEKVIIGLDLERMKTDKDYIIFVFEEVLNSDRLSKFSIKKGALNRSGNYIGTVKESEEGFTIEIDESVCELGLNNSYITQLQKKYEIKAKKEQEEYLQRIVNEAPIRNEQIEEYRRNIAFYLKEIERLENENRIYESIKNIVYPSNSDEQPAIKK